MQQGEREQRADGEARKRRAAAARYDVRLQREAARAILDETEREGERARDACRH